LSSLGEYNCDDIDDSNACMDDMSLDGHKLQSMIFEEMKKNSLFVIIDNVYRL